MERDSRKRGGERSRKRNRGRDMTLQPNFLQKERERKRKKEKPIHHSTRGAFEVLVASTVHGIHAAELRQKLISLIEHLSRLVLVADSASHASQHCPCFEESCYCLYWPLHSPLHLQETAALSLVPGEKIVELISRRAVSVSIRTRSSVVILQCLGDDPGMIDPRTLVLWLREPCVVN